MVKKPVPKAKSKRIVIREEYCMGCRLCEVHCITQHSRSKNIIKVYKDTQNRPASGIVFEEKGATALAVQCRHCPDALCIEACLTGALYRDAEGRVLHDKDKCVGCWMCIMVCPWGVIKPDVKGKKVDFKCDLCLEKGFPVCVEHCPNEAVILVDQDGKRVRS